MKRTLEWLMKLIGFFVLLEPIWMLLPFAGFLYGSVLQIERLNHNPKTAWLTHFVFPVLTGGWLGPALALIGLALFCVGAAQIYTAKWRKSGLVTNGLYRFVRHPQYIALTLLGLGILLTWGRAIMFLSFFAMMFLYYYLAKSEEQTCLRLFGAEYERYRERTSFILPGDRALRRLRGWLPKPGLPAPLRVAASFVATTAVCFGCMWLIDAVKIRLRRVPFLTATVRLPDAPAGPVMTAGSQFVCTDKTLVMRGPYRNAAVPGFAETVLRRLGHSAALKEFVDGSEALFVFCAPVEKPGDATAQRGPAPDPHGPDRVRLILMRCRLADGATLADALADKSKRQILRGCIATVNLARPENTDFVEGNLTLPGPGFPGEQRWDDLMQQFAGRERPAVVADSAAPTATLVLVQAPILRTRLDPAFAAQLRDRLAASPVFADRLRKVGAGGNIVAVAFPRPGPNWYRQHHRQPQVSVFVILARLRDGAVLDELFTTNKRDLVGAFIVETDFQREEFVGEITVVGPKRDLEERWRFFLSGVGGGNLYPHRS